MAGALELLEAEHEGRQAHEHLMTECPWYRHVDKGGRDHPDLHCRPATGEPTGLHEGGALVKFAAGPTLTKAEANYRETDSASLRCGTCSMFRDGSCTLVQGPVQADHVCDHWDRGDVSLTPRTPEASTVPQPTVPPGGPGLFHVKGMQLPPYIQHLYKHLVGRYGKHGAYRVAVGVVKKWSQGVNPGGWETKSGKGKRTHPDVRAAAQRNVAEWEEKRARAHAQHARTEAEHAHSAAEEGIGLAVATAPGARPFLLPATPGGKYSQYGMYQNPVQSISPSPPLPPLVSLPTAAEVRAVIPLVPDCSDPSLSATARKFLEQAAYKLNKDDPLAALAVMRSAQTALYAAHKADQGTLLPSAYTANLFTRIPPAGQSSATSAMKQSVTQVQRWRRAEQALAALSDRIRKRYFHGVYNGPSQMARLTEGEAMTSLDKVLALAGARTVTGNDVSEPVVTDTSGAAPFIQPTEGFLDITDGDAARELAALPVIARARVTAYLERARAMAATNRFGASQSALRAMMAAKEAGAHDLARCIHGHVQALAEGGNVTSTPEVASRMQAGDRTVSPQNRPQTVADPGNRTGLSAVEALLTVVGAGKSAGSSAGKSAGHPDAHQLHVEHLEHLHRLHVEHLEHLHRLHREHLAHQATHPAPRAAASTAAKSASTARTTTAAPAKTAPPPGIGTPGPRSAPGASPTTGTQVTVRRPY